LLIDAVRLPAIALGLTKTVMMLSPRKLIYSVQVEGKLIPQGTDTLSRDGKPLTAAWWTIGKESIKTIWGI